MQQPKKDQYNNRGHFGIPKVIFGESGINTPIIDNDNWKLQFSIDVERLQIPSRHKDSYNVSNLKEICTFEFQI